MSNISAHRSIQQIGDFLQPLGAAPHLGKAPAQGAGSRIAGSLAARGECAGARQAMVLDHQLEHGVERRIMLSRVNGLAPAFALGLGPTRERDAERERT